MVGFRRAEAVLRSLSAPNCSRSCGSPRPRAALAMRDMTVAEREIEALAGLPAGTVDEEQLALLRAMLEDVGGRSDNALAGYRPLFEARSRPVAAEAQLRAIRLVQSEKRSDISADEALARLETVSIIWRGGDLEIEALGELGRLYARPAALAGRLPGRPPRQRVLPRARIDAAHAGRDRATLRRSLRRPWARSAAAHRCAGPVLRLQGVPADRQARRRDHPASSPIA